MQALMLLRLNWDRYGPLGIEMLAVAVDGDRSCPLGMGMVHGLLTEREAWG